MFGMLWRFIPLMDPSVKMMAVRDLDSRLTGREAAAVADWLDNTDLPFHIMRDNPHHTTEILGGMWGARMDIGHRAVFHDSMKQLLADVSLLNCVNIISLRLCLVHGLAVEEGDRPGAVDQACLAGGQEHVLCPRCLPVPEIPARSAPTIPHPETDWSIQLCGGSGANGDQVCLS